VPVRAYSKPIKIALADDDEHIRHILRFLFEDDDRFTVVAEASTGREAVAVASLADALVLDIAMPDLDGISAVEELRIMSPATAVIVYTAYDQPYLRAEAQLRGVAGFVSKASGFEVLGDTIAAAVPSPASGEATGTDGRQRER
jgi:DNA-binding NarL/FixJ family response regulator